MITKFIEPQLQPTPYGQGVHDPHDRRQIGGCLLACGVLLSFTSCASTATACQCSVLNAASPVKVDICAGCMAIFFPAAGADLIVAADYCKGGNGAIGALAKCSAQCNPLLRGYGSCKDVNCLCPTVATAGEPCSQCLAGINTGDASVVGSLISQCAGAGNTVLTTSAGGATVTPTAALLSNSESSFTPTASVLATSGTHSGASGVSVGLVWQCFMNLFLFVVAAGAIGIIL